MKKTYRILAVVLSVALLSVFFVSLTITAQSSKPVILPFLVRNEGNDSETVLRTKLIKDFNEKYKGKYEIKIEWVPGLAAEYRTKLKMLNAANSLPALVTDLQSEPAFGDLLIKNHRLMDLAPYFKAAPAWRKMCLDESIKYTTTKDGKMYTAPSTTANYVGIYYNKEMFAKAGIAEFPKTWEDFWSACDKLKASGFTPISLHTTETGWCAMLAANAYFALSKEGKKFINTQYPTNFDVPVVRDAMSLVKRLFSYSTPDAVGGNYALAANHFCNGDTAMIPNGPWMISSLSDPKFSPAGFEKKVGYAHFPGGIMLSWLGLHYGDAVSMDQPLQVRKGVVEWLKFVSTPEVIKQYTISVGDLSPKVKLSDAEKAQLNPVMKENVNMVESMKGTAIIYQNQWDPITQNETIPKQLPALIMGTITVKQFCEQLTESAIKYSQQNKQ